MKRTLQQVTIETQRITVVRPLRQPVITWCDECGARVEMFFVDCAAHLLGLTPREIYRRVESDAIHFLEADDGTLLICTAGREAKKV